MQLQKLKFGTRERLVSLKNRRSFAVTVHKTPLTKFCLFSEARHEQFANRIRRNEVLPVAINFAVNNFTLITGN
jgi:hypothetical protein